MAALFVVMKKPKNPSKIRSLKNTVVNPDYRFHSFYLEQKEMPY
jgi:hypothetical protein